MRSCSNGAASSTAPALATCWAMPRCLIASSAWPSPTAPRRRLQLPLDPHSPVARRFKPSPSPGLCGCGREGQEPHYYSWHGPHTSLDGTSSERRRTSAPEALAGQTRPVREHAELLPHDSWVHASRREALGETAIDPRNDVLA